MKKITLTQDQYIDGVKHKKGAAVELDTNLANALIKAGYAEEWSADVSAQSVVRLSDRSNSAETSNKKKAAAPPAAPKKPKTETSAPVTVLPPPATDLAKPAEGSAPTEPPQS